MKVLVSLAVLIGAFALGWTLGDRAGFERGAVPPSRSLPGDHADLAGVAADVREILLIRDSTERAAAFAAYLEPLGPDAVGAVRSGLESTVVDRGDLELQLFGQWWARYEPRAALRWARKEWEARHPLVAVAIIREWARHEPRAAMARAQNETASRQLRKTFIDATISGWDESTTPGLFEYIQAMGPGQERQEALTVIARRRLARFGPEAAIEWVEDLPDDDVTLKLNAIRRVAAAAAEVDPAAAVAMIERHRGGEYGKLLVERVARAWSRQDPAAAMDWLSTLPDDMERQKGVSEAFRLWMVRDRAEATAWINQIERERWVEPALSIYLLDLTLAEPASAASQALEIQDFNIHNTTVGNILRHWLVVDETAAEAWIAGSEVDPKLAERARKISPPIRERALESQRVYEEREALGAPERRQGDSGSAS